MRKLLWMIFLFGAYIWTVTSGNDQALLEKGKFLYKALVSWFDGAELDFQVKKEKARKKSRRICSGGIAGPAKNGGCR